MKSRVKTLTRTTSRLSKIVEQTREIYDDSDSRSQNAAAAKDTSQFAYEDALAEVANAENFLAKAEKANVKASI